MKRVNSEDLKLNPVLEKALGGFSEHRKPKAPPDKAVIREIKS